MQQRDGQTQEICFCNDANEFVVPIEDGQTAVLVPVEDLRRFPDSVIDQANRSLIASLYV